MSSTWMGPYTRTFNPVFLPPFRARRPDGLLAEGKRSLAAGDAASAVENFQDACSLL